MFKTRIQTADKTIKRIVVNVHGSAKISTVTADDLMRLWYNCIELTLSTLDWLFLEKIFLINLLDTQLWIRTSLHHRLCERSLQLFDLIHTVSRQAVFHNIVRTV